MRKFQKIISSLLLLSTLAVQIPALTAKAEWTPTSAVSSDVALIVNSDTGTVLYSKNADKKVYPASITKLMTALLTVEHFPDLTIQITVESSDIKPLLGTGSSLMGAGLKAGEVLTVKDLLNGLLVSSANDAAMVLARAVGGDVSTFVRMMNERAQELGMTGTHYENPHGLQDADHYTTAKDIYTLSKYAMTKEILQTTVATSSTVVYSNTTKYTLTNTNMLLRPGNAYGYYYKYCRGIKTGSTGDAGICLTSYATNGGVTYYCVIMQGHGLDASNSIFGANTAFADTIALYKWAFGSFSTVTLVKQNSIEAEVPVKLAWNKSSVKLVAESDFTALIPSSAGSSGVTVVPNGMPDTIYAPVTKGEVVTTAEVMLGNEDLGTINLVASESVDRSQTLYIVYLIGLFFGSVWFKLLAAVLVILLAAFFVLSYRKNRKKKLMNKKRHKGKRYNLKKR